MKNLLSLSNLLLPLLLLPNTYSYTAQDLFDAGCDAANVSIILKENPELVNARSPNQWGLYGPPILYRLSLNSSGFCENEDHAIELLKIILATPSVNVNYQDCCETTNHEWWTNHTSLMRAARYRSHDFVKLLLEFPDTDANVVSSIDDYAVSSLNWIKYGDSALFSAMRYNSDMEVARLLIQSPKVNVNLDHGLGFRALMRVNHLVSCDRQLLMTELLLNRSDIDVNAKNFNGEPALWYSFIYDSSYIYGNINKQRPTMEVNNDECSRKIYFKILQHPKLDMDARNNDGANLLMKLVLALESWDGISFYDYGDLHAAFILNTTKSDINARDNAGKTVIMRMSESHTDWPDLYPIKMFTYLINRPDADFSIRSYDGNTAFMLAIRNTSWMYFSEERTGDYPKYTTMPTWSLFGSSQIGNINAKNNAGNTSLILAADKFFLSKRSEMVEFLLPVPGIDVNAQNNDGNNALMIASKSGNVEAVEVLLADPRIDVNAQNNDGNNALMIASKSGEFWAVKVLLADPRIDRHAKNNKGQTARDLAGDNRYITDLLPLNRDTVIGASVGGSLAAVLVIAYFVRRRFRKSVHPKADAVNSSGMDLKPISQNNAASV